MIADAHHNSRKWKVTWAKHNSPQCCQKIAFNYGEWSSWSLSSPLWSGFFFIRHQFSNLKAWSLQTQHIDPVLNWASVARRWHNIKSVPGKCENCYVCWDITWRDNMDIEMQCSTLTINSYLKLNSHDHAIIFSFNWSWNHSSRDVRSRGRGLLCSLYPQKSTFFNGSMGVTENYLDPKVRKISV